MKSRHGLTLAVAVALCACVAATTATATTKAVPACGQLQLNTKAHPCKASGVRCPIIQATGVVGTSTSVAGGIAETSGAYGGLTIDCTAVGDVLKVQAPGHAFMLVHPTTSLDRCGVSGDTITCKFNVPQQRLGLSYVGAWQDSINWRFTPDDPTSHDLKYGSCGVHVVVTLLNGGAVSYSKGATTVCMFAAGDVLK
jgi:hypothetical protein